MCIIRAQVESNTKIQYQTWESNTLTHYVWACQLVLLQPQQLLVIKPWWVVILLASYSASFSKAHD